MPSFNSGSVGRGKTTSSDEIVKFIQDNNVRISHRENGYWSAEIPHAEWISRATFVETMEELIRVLNLTDADHLVTMLQVGEDEQKLKEEHKKIYG